VRNSIVANNTIDTPAAGTASNCGSTAQAGLAGGVIASIGYNLQTGADCPFTATGDLKNTSPLFMTGTPQDNGGNTNTFALNASSPAVDAIPTAAAGCTGTDQRDVSRPQGTGCDIGAYELFQPVEGQQFSEVLAAVGATTASIAWGDGTAASSGAINPATGEVTGTHTYAPAGDYSGTISWKNSDGAPQITPFSVKVQDAPLTASGSAVTAITGVAVTAQVASLTDANPLGAASQFTATINWGDGASSAGTVTAAPGGGFVLSGTHTYVAKGTYQTTVAVADVDGARASAAGAATVTSMPSVTEGLPIVTGTTGAGFSGAVDPNGSETNVHFEYGLDPSYSPSGGPIVYDQQTASQPVGSDFTVHTVSATVNGLLPNALYHVRLVATNGAGTVVGRDQTFMTGKDAAPLPPQLGTSFDAGPVTGVVLIKLPPGAHLAAASTSGLVKGAGYVPLTEAMRLPIGTEVDARAGSLQLTTAAAHKGKTQTGIFGGALFKLSQDRRGLTKGLTTLTLSEGDFPGAPTFASCNAHAAGDQPLAHAAGLSNLILQTLNARDNHGSFRTRGRHAAATVRGTVWTMQERCDGTLTIVHRGTVVVTDFTRRKTITLHAGQRYLARAPLPKPKPRRPKHK
jgi:hypothetical protein